MPSQTRTSYGLNYHVYLDQISLQDIVSLQEHVSLCTYIFMYIKVDEQFGLQDHVCLQDMVSLQEHVSLCTYIFLSLQADFVSSCDVHENITTQADMFL